MDLRRDILILDGTSNVAAAYRQLLSVAPTSTVVIILRDPFRPYVFTAGKLRWLLNGANEEHSLAAVLDLDYRTSAPFALLRNAGPTFRGIIVNDGLGIEGVTPDLVSSGAEPSGQRQWPVDEPPQAPSLPPSPPPRILPSPQRIPNPYRHTPPPAPREESDGSAGPDKPPFKKDRPVIVTEITPGHVILSPAGEFVAGDKLIGSPAAPVERYADYVIYPLERSERAARLADTDPLQVGNDYELEIAVRGTPLGVRPLKGKHAPLVEPQHSQPVTLMVTAEVLDPDLLEIAEPVQRLILPPTGDSTTNACFRLRALAASADAAVKIRLYYEFNLLEVATLRLGIVRRSARPSDQRAHFLLQERSERPYAGFETVVPRGMHIDVVKSGTGFVLTFAVAAGADRTIRFTAPVRLGAVALESELAELRKLWYDLAFSDPYGVSLEARESDFVPWVRRLAEFGHRLWVRLFLQPGPGSAIQQVGRWLEEHPLSEGAAIQISMDREAEDFVFPWALLFDRALPDHANALPDLQGFWGLRCCLEQPLPGSRRSDAPAPADAALRLAFLLWDRFAEAAEQKALMVRLQEAGQGALEVTPPIVSASECLRLLRAGEDHIFYFFAHGYARQRQEATRSTELQQLLNDRYQALPADSPLRPAYQFYFDALNDDAHREDSWIKLSAGLLQLTQLYDKLRDPHLRKRPLIFLNMCHSAHITPALPDSFVQFFGAQGAGAVIGTECPMTSVFASAFGEHVLTSVLRGVPVGRALLDARRHFMARRNPLGLAYTIYGSAMLRFEPPPLAIQAERNAAVAK